MVYGQKYAYSPGDAVSKFHKNIFLDSTLFCKLAPKQFLFLAHRCKSYNYLKEDKICDLSSQDQITVKDEMPGVVQYNQTDHTTQHGLVAVSQSIYHSKDAFLLKQVRIDKQNLCNIISDRFINT